MRANKKVLICEVDEYFPNIFLNLLIFSNQEIMKKNTTCFSKISMIAFIMHSDEASVCMCMCETEIISNTEQYSVNEPYSHKNLIKTENYSNVS